MIYPRDHKKFDARTARAMQDVLRTKTVSAPIVKSPTDGSGRFAALVSTFGPPPDVQGDLVSASPLLPCLRS